MSDVVFINTELFLTDDPAVVEEYEENSFVDFPSYELFKGFFIELGSKYPDGIPEEYFKQLYQSYTTSLATKTLMDLDLIEEVIQDDGAVGWRMKNG